MKPSRLTDQFPALSTDLPPTIQKLQTELEERLVSHRHDRILVQIEANQRPDLFLVSLERLLRYTKSKRLLVLTSASSRSKLQHMWQTAISEDGRRLLARQFPTCYFLDGLDDNTRVCFATVRELQFQQNEHAHQLAAAFDIILVYDFPASLSPVWKRVIKKQQVNYLIAFCENPDQEVIQWFEGAFIGIESKEDTDQPGFSQ